MLFDRLCTVQGSVQGVHGVDEKNVANLNLRGPGVDHNEDTPARARKCIKNRRPAGDGSSKRSIDGSPTGKEYGREEGR